MRMAFLPLMLLLGGGVALGQNPAAGGAKAQDQAQLRAKAEAALHAEERNLLQVRVLEAQNGPAPLTLQGNSAPAATSRPEPIPTQWPSSKLELIPTHWPKVTVELVGGSPGSAALHPAAQGPGTTVVPK